MRPMLPALVCLVYAACDKERPIPTEIEPPENDSALAPDALADLDGTTSSDAVPPLLDAGFMRDVEAAEADGEADPRPRVRWRTLGTRSPDHNGYCGITLDGEVLCWGWAGRTYSPIAGRFTEVSGKLGLGGCAITEEGGVQCWPPQGTWELMNWAPPQQGRWQDIAYNVRSSNISACALSADTRALTCWELNRSWISEQPPGRFTRIRIGPGDACAIHEEGHIECWGFRGILPGRFKDVVITTSGIRALKVDGEVDSTWFDPWQEPPPVGPFEEIAALGISFCGIRPGGRLECWGHDYEHSVNPVYAPPEEPVRGIVGGEMYACAIRLADDTAVCWGHALNGETSPP